MYHSQTLNPKEPPQEGGPESPGRLRLLRVFRMAAELAIPGPPGLGFHADKSMVFLDDHSFRAFRVWSLGFRVQGFRVGGSFF